MGFSCINGGDGQLYALIGFIPGALGEYLDAVRQELAPECPFRSHVTILPPRLLRGATEDLASALARTLHATDAMEIELGEVEVFQATSVIYLGLKSGYEALDRLHDELMQGAFASEEPYPFHPHITLAQEFPVGQLDELVTRAGVLWEQWRQERRFALERLSFVRGLDLYTWESISEYELNRSRVLRTV